jgi:hypothetical protein
MNISEIFVKPCENGDIDVNESIIVNNNGHTIIFNSNFILS